jgi:hypothetical protein
MFVPLNASPYPPAPVAERPWNGISEALYASPSTSTSPFSLANLDSEPVQGLMPANRSVDHEKSFDLPQDATFTEVTLDSMGATQKAQHFTFSDSLSSHRSRSLPLGAQGRLDANDHA